MRASWVSIALLLSFGTSTALSQTLEKGVGAGAEPVKPVPGPSAFETRLKDSSKVEIEFLANQFRAYYAPGALKKATFGWDVDQEKIKAFADIDKAQSMPEIRRAAANFLKSTRDYHVGFSFNTDESASLPFMVRSATENGKNATIVVAVDPSKVSIAQTGFAPGVQILSIGGKPVEDVLKELKAELGQSLEATDQALADIYLTRRKAARAMKVPKGLVNVEFIDWTGNSSVVQMVWNYTPPSMQDWAVAGPSTKSGSLSAFSNKAIGAVKGIRPPMLSSKWVTDSEEAQNASPQVAPFMIGARNSFIPALGSKIWESPKDFFFQAYITRTPQGLIGVVRSPNYTPPDSNVAAKQFAAILNKFNTDVDFILIDQFNNPGGSLFLVYSMASMLIDRATPVPKNYIAMTPDTTETCGSLLKIAPMVDSNELVAQVFGGNVLEGYPVDYAFFQKTVEYCKYIKSEYEQKQVTVTTDPIHLWGVDITNPFLRLDPNIKILVLTNELDFSGGDWFPTILQDSQAGIPLEKRRILIAGSQTAGAGGYVQSIQYHSNFGLNFVQYTGSLAIRADGKTPIENLGVTPDIKLPVTASDYRSNFSTYARRLSSFISAWMSGTAFSKGNTGPRGPVAVPPKPVLN